MKQANSGIQRTFLQLFILKSNTLVLPIDRKTQDPLVHVQEDSEYSLSLEGLAVLSSMHVRIVADCPDSKEGPSCLNIAERNLNIVIRC